MNFVDITKMLEPLSDAMPCGAAAENFPLFDQISYFREADEDGNNDEKGWSYQPRSADWAKVHTLSVEMLETQSKDLQLLCWLAEALMQLHGVAGATEGIAIINQLLTHFWESLHPAGEADQPFRESLLNGLDRVIARYLNQLSFDDAKAITLFNWKRVQIFEQRIAAKPDSQARLLKEGYIPLKEWQKIVSVSAVSAARTITEIQQQLTALHDAISALDSCTRPLTIEVWRIFQETLGKIKEMREFISRFYPKQNEKSLPEVVADLSDNRDSVVTEIVPITPNNTGTPDNTGTPNTHAVSYVQQRAQALAQLEKIIALFRENEPGSPVPYLLERAVRWSAMNMIEWMADLFNNNSPHYADGLQAIFGAKFLSESDLLPQPESAYQNQPGYPGASPFHHGHPGENLFQERGPGENAFHNAHAGGNAYQGGYPGENLHYPGQPGENPMQGGMFDGGMNGLR
ncbi:type VI secretion system protein TssA [Enterobacteriaceae bacterium LUAb1]